MNITNEEMSAEELIDTLCHACNNYIAGVKYSPEYQDAWLVVDELGRKVITRLTRGDKAIKAMEKIDKIYINHRAYDDYVDSVRSIIAQYRGKKCTACNGRGFVFTEKLEKHTCDVCNGDGFI